MKTPSHIDKTFIRDAGHDEAWLQDLLYANPSLLGLGDLVSVAREKVVASGGRLDMLFKDPADSSMYEVEVQLGPTDPSHIIRCIEYWDLEKRRWPQRQHTAVLVAERITTRFFNVVHLLSLNLPIIAVQVDLLMTEGTEFLYFNKILDAYEEPEEENQVNPGTEQSWASRSKWTLDVAKRLLDPIVQVDPRCRLHFTQSYVAINVNGRNSYWLYAKADPQCVFQFSEPESEYQERINANLTSSGVVYNLLKGNLYSFNLRGDSLDNFINCLPAIHQIRFPTGDAKPS